MPFSSVLTSAKMTTTRLRASRDWVVLDPSSGETCLALVLHPSGDGVPFYGPRVYQQLIYPYQYCLPIKSGQRNAALLRSADQTYLTSICRDTVSPDPFARSSCIFTADMINRSQSRNKGSSSRISKQLNRIDGRLLATQRGS